MHFSSFDSYCALEMGFCLLLVCVPSPENSASTEEVSSSRCLSNAWTGIRTVVLAGEGMVCVCLDQAHVQSYGIANENVSTPILSPDSEPSGVFCLQAAGNPSRKFTINGSIKHSGPGYSPVEATWQPGIQICRLRRECHSHLVLSVIRAGAWAPRARPGKLFIIGG